MNPSNTQVTPEIKKVIDSNGDGHTVIPTPHTHAQSEVSGLSAALAGKQNTLTFDSTPTTGSTNPVTSGGVKTALNGKADVGHVHDKIQDEDVRAKVECGTVGNTDAGKIKLSVEDSEGEAQTAEITASNIDNLKRALSDPDSTPTSNSTNLVTSGGVNTALNGKMDNKTIDASPTSNADHLVSSKGVKNALEKKISFNGTYNLFCQNSKLYFDTFPLTFQDAAELDDWIHVKGFPNIVKLDIIVEEHDNYHFLTTASLFIAVETAQPNARFRVNLLIGNTVYVATGTATNYQMDDYTWDNNYFTKFGTLDDL